MLNKKVYDIETTPQYNKWFDRLRNRVAIRRIKSRYRQIETTGNLGNHKDFNGGISELRFEFGPGYRIYYAKINSKVILLTLGGDKSSQDRDIEIAKRILKEYKEDKKDENN
jgi:putative addiction module killer protein